jgi:hypothetical protein
VKISPIEYFSMQSYSSPVYLCHKLEPSSVVEILKGGAPVPTPVTLQRLSRIVRNLLGGLTLNWSTSLTRSRHHPIGWARPRERQSRKKRGSRGSYKGCPCSDPCNFTTAQSNHMKLAGGGGLTLNWSTTLTRSHHHPIGWVRPREPQSCK